MSKNPKDVKLKKIKNILFQKIVVFFNFSNNTPSEFVD